FAGAPRRHDWLDPPLPPAAVDDCAFDRFYRDRIVVDVERAGRLARRRADPASEFREIVRRVQRPERCAPLLAIDEVVPVRDQIVDRTALMTERDAAIHAARRLLAVLGIGQRLDEFLPAAAAALRLLVAPIAAFDLEKAGRLTHGGKPRMRRSFGGLDAGGLPLGLQFEQRASVVLRRDLDE